MCKLILVLIKFSSIYVRIYFRIRRSTWEKLLIYSGGNLSEILHLLSKNDPVYPLLNDKHLEAIDRRLLFIYATVENCKEKYGNDVFK